MLWQEETKQFSFNKNIAFLHHVLLVYTAL